MDRNEFSRKAAEVFLLSDFGLLTSVLRVSLW